MTDDNKPELAAALIMQRNTAGALLQMANVHRATIEDVFGPHTTVRVRQTSAMIDLLRAHAQNLGITGHTIAVEASERLGRLAVGVLHAKDPMSAMAWAMAELTGLAHALEAVATKPPIDTASTQSAAAPKVVVIDPIEKRVADMVREEQTVGREPGADYTNLDDSIIEIVGRDQPISAEDLKWKLVEKRLTTRVWAESCIADALKRGLLIEHGEDKPGHYALGINP